MKKWFGWGKSKFQAPLGESDKTIISQAHEACKRFSYTQILDLYAEYTLMLGGADRTKGVPKKNFIEKTRVLKNASAKSLAEKIFNAIDISSYGNMHSEDSERNIDFTEFVKYFDILYNGTHKEKMQFSFNIIDTEKDKKLTEENMKDIFGIMLSIQSVLTGNESVSPKKIQGLVDYIFKQYGCENTKVIHLDEFLSKSSDNTELFQIFESLNANNIDHFKTEDDFSDLVLKIESIQTNFSLIYEYIKDVFSNKSSDKIGELELTISWMKIGEDGTLGKSIGGLVGSNKNSLELGGIGGLFSDSKLKNDNTKLQSMNRLLSNLDPISKASRNAEASYQAIAGLFDNKGNNPMPNMNIMGNGPKTETGNNQNGFINDMNIGDGKSFFESQHLVKTSSVGESNHKEADENDSDDQGDFDSDFEDIKLKKKTTSKKSTKKSILNINEIKPKIDQEKFAEIPTAQKNVVGILKSSKKESLQDQSNTIKKEITIFSDTNMPGKEVNSPKKKVIVFNKPAIKNTAKNARISINEPQNGRINIPQDIKEKIIDSLERLKLYIDDASWEAKKKFELKQKDQKKTSESDPKSKDGNNLKQEMLKDAMIPANIIKQNKANESDKDMVFIGNQSWDLVLSIMVGMFKAIRSLYDNKFYEISEIDYTIKTTFEIPAMSKDVSFSYWRFYDYSPYIFNSIRRMSGIDPNAYLESIGTEKIMTRILSGSIKTLSELWSPGQSGSFLYFTHDGNYILKTIPYREYVVMRKTIRDYHSYIINHPNSMIARYYGLHRIDLVKSDESSKTYYFLTMRNIFKTTKPLKFKYDLKGSTFKRKTNIDGLTPEQISNKCLKDLNWIDLGEKIVVEDIYALSIRDVISKDAEFLKKIGIIDYSMLVGIIENNNEELNQHKLKQMGSKMLKTEGQIVGEGLIKMAEEKNLIQRMSEFQGFSVQSKDGRYTYLLGIIDTFTDFGFKKFVEAKGKMVIQGKGVSWKHPTEYGDRFKKFIWEQILSEAEYENYKYNKNGVLDMSDVNRMHKASLVSFNQDNSNQAEKVGDSGNHSKHHIISKSAQN